MKKSVRKRYSEHLDINNDIEPTDHGDSSDDSDEEEFDDISDKVRHSVQEDEDNIEISDKDDDDNDDNNNNNDETEEEISSGEEVEEEELSFEDRLRLAQEKKKDEKDEVKQNSKKTTSSVRDRKKQKTLLEVKKKNKNAPKEVSSKIRVRRVRDVVSKAVGFKKNGRDPRFDAISGGDFRTNVFHSDYGFVGELQKSELEKLKKHLRENKDSLSEEDFNSIQRRISQLNGALKKQESQKLKEQIKREHYSKEAEKVSNIGKKPFYLSEGKVKKIAKVKKFEELKASGKLDKYLEKKRKKTRAKDHILMPKKRARTNE